MDGIMQSGFDTEEFFGEVEFSEEVVGEVAELRAHLGEYRLAKDRKSKGEKVMAESKTAIQSLFEKLPKELKTEKQMEVKEVAGQTFARQERIITIDGWNLVLRDKVNTKSPRDKYIAELTLKAQKATSPEAKAAYQDAIKLFESHLDPTLGSEFKIDPIAAKK